MLVNGKMNEMRWDEMKGVCDERAYLFEWMEKGVRVRGSAPHVKQVGGGLPLFLI